MRKATVEILGVSESSQTARLIEAPKLVSDS